jgi:hypothetical protein
VKEETVEERQTKLTSVQNVKRKWVSVVTNSGNHVQNAAMIFVKNVLKVAKEKIWTMNFVAMIATMNFLSVIIAKD